MLNYAVTDAGKWSWTPNRNACIMSDGSLWYAAEYSWLDGATWRYAIQVRKSLDGGVTWSTDYTITGLSSYFVSMDVGPSDVLHIAYVYGNPVPPYSWTLRHQSRVSGVWGAATTIWVPLSGAFSSLTMRVDSTNKSHFAGYETTGGLRPSYQTLTSGDILGTLETVGSVQYSVSHISLALDSNDKPHIVWVAEPEDGDEKRIMYSNRVSGSWITPEQLQEGADLSGAAGGQNLEFDSSGNLWCIFYAYWWDIEYECLYIKKRTSGVWGSTITVKEEPVSGIALCFSPAGIPYVYYEGESYALRRAYSSDGTYWGVETVAFSSNTNPQAEVFRPFSRAPENGECIVLYEPPAGYDARYSMLLLLDEPPLAVGTDAATGPLFHGATLNGTLQFLAGESTATVWFEYGETSGGPYTDTTPSEVLTALGTFSATIDHLQKSTTYYFRAVADNGSEVSYGDELDFTTEGTKGPVIKSFSGPGAGYPAGESAIILKAYRRLGG